MSPHSSAEGDVSHHAPAFAVPPQSAQLFNALYEQAVVGVALVNATTGCIVWANGRYGSIVGLPQTDLAATPFHAMAHSEDLPMLLDQIEALKAGRMRTCSAEHRCARPDGSLAWVAIALSPLWDIGQPPTTYIAFVEDITDRRQALLNQQKSHQALDALSQKYRALIDQAVTGVSLIQHGRFVFVNSRTCTILQRSAEDLLALPSVLEIVAPEDRALVEQRMKDRLARIEVSPHYLLRAVRPDGSLRWVEVYGTRIDFEGGAAILGMANDVTDRMQAEAESQQAHQELERLYRQYSTLVERAIVGIYIIRDERVLYANPVLCQLVGRSKEDILATPSLLDALFTDGRVLSREQMRQRFAGIAQNTPYSVRVMRPDGSLVWLEVFGTMIDYEGQPAILGTAVDVTERRKAEEAQQRLLTELVEAQERLQGLSQRLMHLQEEERREIARDLHDEIGQALTLLRADLSDAKRTITGKLTMDPSARLDSGLSTADGLIQRVRAMSLNLRPVMLDDLGLPDTIRWYIDQIAPRAGWTADVVADEELEDLPKPIALAAFRIMQESLTNVMRHAAATQVRVEAVKKDGSLQVCIRDNGKGFDVERVLKQASQGLSVGLLSMQERLRVLGGEIVLHSTPGAGTIVQMQIPLEAAV